MVRAACVAGVASFRAARSCWGHPAFTAAVWGAGVQPQPEVVASVGGHLPQPPAGQEGGCAAAGAAWHCGRRAWYLAAAAVFDID